MKTVLPWIIVVLLFGGVFFLFKSNSQKDAQIAALTLQSQEIDSLRTENDELRKSSADKGEMERLRGDHEELLRLRNEAQHLRDQNKQLGGQLANTQSRAAQIQQAQQQLASENQALHDQAQQAQTLVQQQTDACVANLRLIDAAKQQWALETKKAAADIPTAADLAPYFTNQVVCPAGGAYSINAVGAPPTCTIPGHVLQK